MSQITDTLKKLAKGKPVTESLTNYPAVAETKPPKQPKPNTKGRLDEKDEVREANLGKKIFDSGKKEGIRQGLESGRKEGMRLGKKQGYTVGFADGQAKGYRDGGLYVSQQYATIIEATLSDLAGFKDPLEWHKKSQLPAWWISVLLQMNDCLNKLPKIQTPTRLEDEEEIGKEEEKTTADVKFRDLLN